MMLRVRWIDDRILRLFSVAVVMSFGWWLPIFPGVLYLCFGIGIAFDILRFRFSSGKRDASMLIRAAALLCLAAGLVVLFSSNISLWPFWTAVYASLILGMLAVVLHFSDEGLSPTSARVREVSKILHLPQGRLEGLRWMFWVLLTQCGMLLMVTNHRFLLPFFGYVGQDVRLPDHEVALPLGIRLSQILFFKTVVLLEVALLLVVVAVMAHNVQRYIVLRKLQRSLDQSGNAASR